MHTEPTPLDCRPGGLYFGGRRVLRIDPPPWSDSTHEQMNEEAREAGDGCARAMEMLAWAVVLVLSIAASVVWPGAWW